jgi:GTP pyrophosphokinase
VELAQGATPLDFAYHIHTEVGHRCRGAKVNGRIVPLTYELKTGEQVHVLTAKSGGPSRDWLSPHLGYLKSPRSRSKVRQWFKQQDHDKSISAGRVALEREFHRLGINVKQIGLEKVADKLGFARLEELFAAIGSGDLNAGAVVARVQEQVLPAPRAEFLPVSRKPRIEGHGAQIEIRGVGNLLTQMARCCKPAPYDPIVGFITHGRGVTIHRQDCSNVVRLQEHQRERLIEVDWGSGGEGAYSVDVEVDAYDRSGLLRDITSILANERVNVSAANTSTDAATATARMLMTLEIADLEQLIRILDKIGQLPNVFDARRKV